MNKLNPAVFLRTLFLLVALAFGSTVVRAESLGAIKARMEQRQGAVDALKERKLVGENNRGLLEARASLKPPEEKTVSDENADRRDVYAAIAAQTGATAEEVGRRRAQQIAGSSRRGVWVQAPDGTWAEKE